MKKIKFLPAITAAILSGTICMNMFSSFITASACSNCNPPTDEVHGMGDLLIPGEDEDFSNQLSNSPDTRYTLEELFAMNKEEFLALKGADSCYDMIKEDAEYCRPFFDSLDSRGISGVICLFPDYADTKKYKANITEMELKELLGDTVKYEIGSPICDYNGFVREGIFLNRLVIYFPDYEKSNRTEKIDDKYITEFAKCWYCALQAVDIDYEPYGTDYGSFSEEIVPCDVNLDLTFDLNDVIWVSKSLVKQFELSELQVNIADTNKDGKADLTDAIALSRKLLEK